MRINTYRNAFVVLILSLFGFFVTAFAVRLLITQVEINNALLDCINEKVKRNFSKGEAYSGCVGGR